MGSHRRRASLLLTLIVSTIDCSWSFHGVSVLSECGVSSRTARAAVLRTLVALHAKEKKGPKQKSQAGQTMAVNRVAYRNYEIIEKFEAGISLKGTEGL
jgi:hypothetical protein